MFGFRRKRPAPSLCRSNPGIGVEAKVSFANGLRTWTEQVNLVGLAEDAFKKRDYSVVNETTWLRHSDSHFMILPQIVEIHPLDKGGVRTVTTMQVNHPELSPDGVFEFQHSTGDNVADSISRGFDQWLQMDFVPLLDALRPKPEACTVLEMALPAKDGRPARVRRAVLGPVAHFRQKPPSQGEKESPKEHPFCPCCLLTKTFEAFRTFLEGDGFYGLRLFAARDAEGTPQADCRVNGEDWEKGAQRVGNMPGVGPPPATSSESNTSCCKV